MNNGLLVKPLILCKTFSAVVILSFISLLTLAQSCEEPRRPALVAYLQYKGAGWELGWWPEGSPVGFFGGMGASKQFIRSSSNKDSLFEMIGTEVYGKIQLRLIEGVALTASAGMLNAQEVFYSAGIRFNFPINDETAIIGEPQVGKRGFNFQLGMAKRF